METGMDANMLAYLNWFVPFDNARDITLLYIAEFFLFRGQVKVCLCSKFGIACLDKCAQLFRVFDNARDITLVWLNCILAYYVYQMVKKIVMDYIIGKLLA